MYRYIKSSWFVILFLFLAVVFGIPRNVQGAKWSMTGKSNYGRGGGEGAVLTDGRVMVMGAFSGVADHESYEIFDPATGTWPISGLLPYKDWIGHHMGILLPNGKVLYLAGPSNEVHRYDPINSSWSPSTASISWTQKCCATLLKDGDVLLMYDSQNCKLYHYLTDGVTPTGSADLSHIETAEVLLPDGRVLVIGVADTLNNKKCEIYDPTSRTWKYTGFTHNRRYRHVGMLLPPPWSKVLIAGPEKYCELYDPVLETWLTTDTLNKSLRVAPTMALLPSGEALIMGGADYSGDRKSCELYDPAVETWTLTDDMEIGRTHFTSAVLHTGKVMAIGKFGGGYVHEIYDPSDGVWDTKVPLSIPRSAHTVTPLPIIPTSNCSTNVLIAGGENSGGALKYCELYNYSLDHVILTDELTEARSHHTAVLLSDGRVLASGGKDGATTRSSSELYDASTQSWSTTGAMTDARFDHSATLLANGDVLVTGGENGGYLSSCEIYNSGSWTPTGSALTTPRARHTAVMLLNGDILVIGGETTGGAVTNSCELWNGSNWSPANPLSTARCLHTAILLQSGKVLVIGGKGSGGGALSSCEIYDAGNWTAEGSLNQARHSHNATLLYSGLVLVTGGNGSATSCEIWDPAAGLDTGTNTHKWKVTKALITGREYHSSVLIPDTMPFILAIGGKSGASYLNSIEEYDVGLGYRSEWQSTITSHSAVTTISNSMHIEGTLFRGVSEADGGNHCHIVSNDHPIISLVRIGGGNWQGNGGGEILHMPLSSSWDTAHTIVHPKIADFQGYYRLWSIVNGIPCKWYNECPYGTEEKTGIRHKATGISVSVYPNPATTKASIKFRVQSSELKNSQLATHNSQLTIYDLSGRLIRFLPITDNRTPITEVTWDGQDSKGKKVNSGIYFYSVKYKNSGAKGKFIILK